MLDELMKDVVRLNLTKMSNCDMALEVCWHVLEDRGPCREAREIALKVQEVARERALYLNDSDWMRMYWLATRAAAQHGDFDSYMLYLERNRPRKKRFYHPRRRILRKAVRDIQALLDAELDEVFLSMPPRVGKTTLLLFLVTFMIGLFPEWTNLYTSYSDSVTKAFYNGVLEIIKSTEEYSWPDVFPRAGSIKTYAKEEGVDIGRDRRYHSVTCRSIKSSMNGVLDVSGIAICDDLLKGIEEALNPSLMDKTWNQIDNNLVGRLKNNTRILWCGTRWAEKDPIGRRLNLLSKDARMASRRYSAIVLPALDENDESNFDFDPDFVAESPDDVKVGFSTETYHQRRASFERSNDIASWLAQYMGQPVDRTGALFAPEVMRFYENLPEGEPDDVLMHVDPAYGGGDYLSGPVALIYGKDVYLADVIFSTENKFKTRPRVVEMVGEWDVHWLQVEQNNGGEDYAEAVEAMLLEQDIVGVNVTSRPAPNTTSKVARICDAAPEILRFWFPDPRIQGREMRQFMTNLYSFSPKVRNVHDDAADSLAAMAGMVRGEGRAKPARVRVFRRPF